ncbi:MAG: bifunctional N(6)-L-threonylcarbamoyladenine synthase/serine/threonine protein kinase [Candidatus Aenigmatarchaeota archaeon]|nr:MAG: bifunctional N(6)-L-threonylcarbamoyladenine synthase/serine/threonine protein kinase [Candidatus Aenigmarchaeota archaeon]
MLCIGIESTARTFGIGVVSDKGDILSNVKSVYIPPAGWGIKPVEAAEHHRSVCNDVLEKALKKAKIDMSNIELIAFSQGPGLPPCLHVGLNFALEISKSEIPIIGVNHCIAHVEIGRLMTGMKDPVVLYVSGGNTQVLSYIDGYYRCFGETMDMGVGNALDKFGREAGLQFPAGPEIERLAKGGKYIELPYVVKGMDLSFSGIVTAALNKLKSGFSLRDVCFSLQETFFSMLTEVTERALAHTGKEQTLLTGGVASNQRLKEMLRIMCEERGANFSCVPKEFAGDNGAMIAWTGILMNRYGVKTEPEIKPRQRTDEVEAVWFDWFSQRRP